MKLVPSYIEVLKNQLLTGFEQTAEDELIIKTAEISGPAHTYRFYHSQECCESVGITSIEGPDADKIIGNSIIEVSEEVNESGTSPSTQTITIHKFAFSNGASITVTWTGESNGYYSESVSFAEVVN